MNFLLILLVISIKFPSYVRCLIGPNICSYSGVGYCCAEFEEINDTCVACGDGYTSFKGNPCEPCKDDKYGPRCVKKCSCNTLQRCDNVLGCVDKFTKTTRALSFTTKGHTTLKTTYWSGLEIPVTEHVDDVVTSRETTVQQDQSTDGLTLSTQVVLLVYSAAILVFAIAVFLLFRCVKYINTKCKPNAYAIPNQTDIELGTANSGHQYSLPEDRHYDIIIDLPISPPGDDYLDVIAGSNSSHTDSEPDVRVNNSERGRQEDLEHAVNTGYKYPYTLPTITWSGQRHEYAKLLNYKQNYKCEKFQVKSLSLSDEHFQKCKPNVSKASKMHRHSS